MPLDLHARPRGPVSARRPSAERLRRWAPLAGLAAVAALAAVLFAVVGTALIDDAYITLGYAENLAFHGHWGLIDAEIANSATAPLNVLVLAAVTVVLRDPISALGVVFVVAHVVVTWALYRSAQDSGFPVIGAVLGTLMLLVNPFLLSSVGLEMTLAAALLALLLLAIVQDRPVLFGVVAGLLAVTRLDLGVFVVAALLGRPRLWRAWWKWLVAACAVSLPWFVLSWFVLGSAVPDTLLIKQLQASWGRWTFDNGLRLYASVYPSATGTAVAAAGFGLVTLLVWLVARMAGRDSGRRLQPWALVGIGGAAHYVAYTTLDVPPYHWYYAPSMIGLTILFAGGIGALARLAESRRPLPLLVSAAVVAAACGLAAGQGRVVLAQGVPWRYAAVTTNWAAAADYERIGRLVGEAVGTATVRSPGEIGTLAYYCDCAIVDRFSDRGYLAAQIRERTARTGTFGRWLLESNYTRFTPTEPRPIDFTLRRVSGHGPDPRWNIDSPWMGPGHLVLERVGRD